MNKKQLTMNILMACMVSTGTVHANSSFLKASETPNLSGTYDANITKYSEGTENFIVNDDTTIIGTKLVPGTIGASKNGIISIHISPEKSLSIVNDKKKTFYDYAISSQDTAKVIVQGTDENNSSNISITSEAIGLYAHDGKNSGDEFNLEIGNKKDIVNIDSKKNPVYVMNQSKAKILGKEISITNQSEDKFNYFGISSKNNSAIQIGNESTDLIKTNGNSENGIEVLNNSTLKLNAKNIQFNGNSSVKDAYYLYTSQKSNTTVNAEENITLLAKNTTAGIVISKYSNLNMDSKNINIEAKTWGVLSTFDSITNIGSDTTDIVTISSSNLAVESRQGKELKILGKNLNFNAGRSAVFAYGMNKNYQVDEAKNIINIGNENTQIVNIVSGRYGLDSQEGGIINLTTNNLNISGNTEDSILVTHAGRINVKASGKIKLDSAVKGIEVIRKNGKINIEGNTDINAKYGIIAYTGDIKISNADNINVNATKETLIALSDGHIDLNAKNISLRGNIDVHAIANDSANYDNTYVEYAPYDTRLPAIINNNDATINITADKIKLTDATVEESFDNTTSSIIDTYNGGQTAINGHIDIYSKQAALTAGEKSATAKVTNPSVINITYDESEGVVNNIHGSISAGYKGIINIGKKYVESENTTENKGVLNVTGNILAGNGGTVSLDISNGSTFIGRTDNYKKATEKSTLDFYRPRISNEVVEKGNINLSLGENSYWDVTGQSWVDNLELGKGATVDLLDNSNNKNSNFALSVDNISGEGNFIVNLDAKNLEDSEMIYINRVTSDKVLNEKVTINNIDNVDDLLTGNLDKLRFATVNEGKDKIKFTADYKGATLKDRGVQDKTLYVSDEAYDKKDEDNAMYNSRSLLRNKPGELEENANARNWYISLENSVSDAGRATLNMTRANYDQAVTLETLNNRLGEARYLTGDEGLWVRLGHSRLGKEDGYKIRNNIYQLGYDKKHDKEDWIRRTGVSLDYIHGSTTYDDIWGKGVTNRKGISLYDTWFSKEDGKYRDYVAKWGHLENEFDFTTKSSFEKINGEYNNDVYSISGEWGNKKELKHKWFVEPQAQVQYAYISKAAYETSQNTKVQVDGTHSLIGRLGVRVGKDVDEKRKSNVYIKANVLHEFLGEQDVFASDITTLDTNGLAQSYSNKGTWYNVGFGVSTMLTDNSYAYVDYERNFGNGNENSYKINGGISWKL